MNVVYGINGVSQYSVCSVYISFAFHVDAREDIPTSRNVVYGINGDVIPYVHDLNKVCSLFCAETGTSASIEDGHSEDRTYASVH